MRLVFRKVEWVFRSDDGVFRIAVVSVRRHFAGIDGDDGVDVVFTARSTWVSAHVASSVDGCEGDVDARGDEGVSVDDGSIGPVSSGGRRDGTAASRTEVAVGRADGPVEDGRCVGEIVAVCAGVFHRVVPGTGRTSARADWAVGISWRDGSHAAAPFGR